MITGAILLSAIIILLWFGRAPICECGSIKLWHGEVMSSENSQHLSDWYSPSHFIHGLLFYALFAWLAKGWPLGLRFNLSVLIEAVWEVSENTNYVISRYREATIALDYYGDSVLNSAADILFMIFGFWFAWRMPVWLSVSVAIALELAVGLLIRDNLTLNVIMLIYPLEAIKTWQMG